MSVYDETAKEAKKGAKQHGQKENEEKMNKAKTPEQVVRAFIDTYATRDTDAALAFLSEDFTRLGDMMNWTPMNKQWTGDMWARFFAAFPDWTWKLTTLAVSGDTVACELVEHGTWTEPYAIMPGLTLPPTGTAFLEHDSIWFRVNGDGLINQVRGYFTNDIDRKYHLVSQIDEFLAGTSAKL